MQASIAEVKARLCDLVDDIQRTGEPVVILRHGKPAARILPMPGCGRPWRVKTPDDPKAYEKVDLDAPVLDEIQ